MIGYDKRRGRHLHVAESVRMSECQKMTRAARRPSFPCTREAIFAYGQAEKTAKLEAMSAALTKVTTTPSPHSSPASVICLLAEVGE